MRRRFAVGDVGDLVAGEGHRGEGGQVALAPARVVPEVALLEDAADGPDRQLVADDEHLTAAGVVTGVLDGGHHPLADDAVGLAPGRLRGVTQPPPAARVEEQPLAEAPPFELVARLDDPRVHDRGESVALERRGRGLGGALEGGCARRDRGRRRRGARRRPRPSRGPAPTGGSRAGGHRGPCAGCRPRRGAAGARRCARCRGGRRARRVPRGLRRRLRRRRRPLGQRSPRSRCRRAGRCRTQASARSWPGLSHLSLRGTCGGRRRRRRAPSWSGRWRSRRPRRRP
ncbi:ABC transporter ATPase [Janibacter hoylei PVAS-1]|uniref:ABC transporter ATPase n=1 Tax=Janibacter hoylei PVAS-1 TaxID=1210046 RepID=K1E961_9MICO|nr:ABC transporter ATPase [Janibacter hoylei PVAS-1]